MEAPKELPVGQAAPVQPALFAALFAPGEDLLVAERVLAYGANRLLMMLELVCRSWRDFCLTNSALWQAAFQEEWGVGCVGNDSLSWRRSFHRAWRTAVAEAQVAPFSVSLPQVRVAPGEEIFVVVIGQHVYELRPSALQQGLVHRVRLRLGTPTKPATPLVSTSALAGAPVFLSSVHSDTSAHRGLLRHTVCGKINLYSVDYRTWRCKVLARNCLHLSGQHIGSQLILRIVKSSNASSPNASTLQPAQYAIYEPHSRSLIRLFAELTDGEVSVLAQLECRLWIVAVVLPCGVTGGVILVDPVGWITVRVLSESVAALLLGGVADGKPWGRFLLSADREYLALCDTGFSQDLQRIHVRASRGVLLSTRIVVVSLVGGHATILTLRAVVVSVGVEQIAASFRMRCWWDTDATNFHWVSFERLTEDGHPVYYHHMYNCLDRTTTDLGEAVGEMPVDVHEVRPGEIIERTSSIRVEQVWSGLTKPSHLPQGAVRCMVQGWSRDKQRALAKVQGIGLSGSHWVFVNRNQCSVQVVSFEPRLKVDDLSPEVVFATYA